MDYWVKSVILLVGLVSVVESLGELYEQLEKSFEQLYNTDSVYKSVQTQHTVKI